MQQHSDEVDGSKTPLRRVPFFTPIMLAVLLAMVAEAMAGSYMALLAVQRVGMSPLELSAFLTVPAATGLVVTTIFGHLQDRNPVVWPLLLSLFSKAVGLTLCAYLTDTWLLVLNAGVLFGLSAASFALLFAVAKAHLDQIGGSTVLRGMAALRLIASLSWTIGPALGAILIALKGFAGVYFGAALLAAASLVIVSLARIKVVSSEDQEREKLSIQLLLRATPAVFALSAFHTAMFMGSNAMSIVVAEDIGSQSDVGVLFSLCAGLEVIFMGVFIAWPDLSTKSWLLFMGFALFAAYFVMAIAWPTMWSLYLGQVPRAAGIGIISIVGMEMVQRMLLGRAGTASALFGNTISVGFLLSGLGTGVWANSFGYWSLFVLCAALCVFGTLALLCSPGVIRTHGDLPTA
ncbi:MFS transporter [Rhizobium sp. S152]|uniref:MFS transporter n=1 Tax=Rhizobium sp. S152 TaxID=3055038 RepID=UPI0025A9719B|nr:MFS transporter [Rhizobium sp. S152]MDM9627604.1 MFS transporter [Rhizobium sp. S152]